MTRPALVLAVGAIEGETAVEVAFGTSHRTSHLYRAEFLIGPEDGDAFRTAGLRHPSRVRIASPLIGDELHKAPVPVTVARRPGKAA